MNTALVELPLVTLVAVLTACCLELARWWRGQGRVPETEATPLEPLQKRMDLLEAQMETLLVQYRTHLELTQRMAKDVDQVAQEVRETTSTVHQVLGLLTADRATPPKRR